jgi:hypothetical protein
MQIRVLLTCVMLRNEASVVLILGCSDFQIFGFSDSRIFGCSIFDIRYSMFGTQIYYLVPIIIGIVICLLVALVLILDT